MGVCEAKFSSAPRFEPCYFGAQVVISFVWEARVASWLPVGCYINDTTKFWFTHHDFNGPQWAAKPKIQAGDHYPKPSSKKPSPFVLLSQKEKEKLFLPRQNIPFSGSEALDWVIPRPYFSLRKMHCFGDLDFLSRCVFSNSDFWAEFRQKKRINFGSGISAWSKTRKKLGSSLFESFSMGKSGKISS